MILFMSALSARSQSPLVIDGATLIDGSGGPPLPNSVIVIRGRHIAAAGGKGQVAVPDGARVIDGSGKFVIPGLIDCHIHYDGPRDLLQLISWGVTSANCMFESTDQALEMERLTSGDTVHAPRIYGTAPIFTAVHGWWWGEGFPLDSSINRFPGGPDEAPDLVTKAKAKGIKRIKLMYDDMGWCRDPLPKLTRMREDIMRALVAAARNSDLVSEVHAPILNDALLAIDAGVSALAHGILDAPFDSGSVAKITRDGLYYMPTFCVFEFLADVEGFMKGALSETRFRDALPEATLRRYTGDEYFDHYRKTYPNIQFVQSHLPVLRDNMKRLAEHHANVVMGTDMWAFPGIGAHLELEYMVRAGMTPMQAIVSATSLGAKFLGEAGTKGTIEAGKEADLLILDYNPLDDIRNTRSIRQIIKQGVLFEHDALIEESKR
jgi:imidazolonepropionase-like amidohydrolase